MSDHVSPQRRSPLVALRETLLPDGLGVADRWVCALVVVCFCWPALVIFVEQTIIAVSTITQSLGIAVGAVAFGAIYAVIAYPLLRSVPRSLRAVSAIALALVIPVCIRFALTGVFLPGLRPSAGWLLRVVLSTAALYATARWLRRRHLFYVVGLFVIITTAIAWHHYYRGDWIVDLFTFRQALWTTLHGQGFFYASDEGGSHFGTHNSPMFFLLLPLYAIWDSGALLMLVQSVAVGLSAYPVYGLARDRLDEKPALVLTVGFLLLPPVIGPTLTMFKEFPFALPLFLAALLAFERGRLKAFAAWAAALLLVRETLVITVILFALYALLRRRSWRWVVIPAAIGLAWGAFSFGVVMPHFFVPGKSDRPFLALYGELGSSMQEVAVNVVRHPAAAADRLYRRENMDYVEHLTRPFGRFLPLGSVVTAFAVPDAVMVGLSRHRGWPTHDVSANYHVIIAAALAAAMLYALLGLTRRLRLTHLPTYLALGLFFVTALADALPIIWDPPRAGILPDRDVRARQEIVAMIPPEASVNATYRMLTQLAHRREVYPVIPFTKHAQRWVSTDYVIMADEVGNQVLMDRLRAEGYRLVATRGSFVVYQKPGAPPLGSGGGARD